MSVKIRGLKQGQKYIHNTVRKASIGAMKESMKDLHRVASETTPYDEGDLEMGGFHGVDIAGAEITGWVGFEAFNKGFNYAIWTHEETYNLGEGSQKKSGGHGMSGASYPVGNKYLSRPHEGEAPTYRNLIEQDIKDALK
jgi:hypothetical protein